MLYNCLKILHILSATLLLTSMGYSFYLWRFFQTPPEAVMLHERIQKQTWLIILPVALFQLATGFTMLSLKNEDFSQSWIIGSVIGFIVVIGSWFSFIYFLLLSQQVEIEHARHKWIFKFYRHAQSAMLVLCGIALISMIFFMANKI